MRIVGSALMVIGIPFLLWLGYVELYFLPEIESEFEEQRIKSEEKIRNKIKETKYKFDTMKANVKKGKKYNKNIKKLDNQLNDLILGLKTNYKKQEEGRKDLLNSTVVTIRNENFTVETGVVGVLFIIIGGIVFGATFLLSNENDINETLELTDKEDLEEASIEENISSPKLIEAKLLKANLNDANLSESDLSGTNLVGVNLSNVNLSGANLSGTNLSKVDLTGSNLTKADLTGAKLVDANLTGADLTEADLSRANLSGANLSGTNLTKANLTGVNLRNSYLEDNLLS
tara:strand:+ start:3452 stop:4315 length:864 start_codon:yes stop_codon:yes gene_type:complete